MTSSIPATTRINPDALTYNADGLIPAITQDVTTGEVLMMAWMNRESLQYTLQTGIMHYWSRSRAALWRKGETSGHEQQVVELWADCDTDTILAKIHQIGAACHTGRRSCFFQKIPIGKSND